MPSLFKIGQDMQALDDLLEAIGGDVTDEALDAVIQEWLEENAQNLAGKVDNIVRFHKDLTARAKAKRELAREYDALARFDEKKAERLKTRLLDFMQERGWDLMEGNVHKVTVTLNGGKRPVIVPDELDLAKVPREFIIETPSLDKEKVYEALKAGKVVPFAKLGPQGSHLRIK
jgi:hypothetical protein